MSSPTDREILSTRLIAAPCEHVFRAFADPTLLARWWGPNGFTNTIQQFDFQPGGAWRFVMHGPDGTDYANASDFVEVVPPERIVFVHHLPMHRFETTMTFAEEACQTRLAWRMVFDSAEEYEKIKDFIPAANEQNFDRLEAVLATMA